MFYVRFQCAGLCSELRCDLHVQFDRTVEVVPETNKRFYPAGSNISEAEKDDWRKQAVAFLEMLKMQAMEDKDDKLHAKKQYRLKVYQNLPALETPGVDDVVDASDHQLLEEFCAKAKQQDEGEQSLTTLIRDTRTAASKRGKGRRRAIAFPGDRCITIEEARSMLPPGYSIRRDSHQKRWQVFLAMHLHDGSRWSKSSSWGIAGDERTAALNVLKAAWARHCSLHGEVNPLQ